MQAVHYSLPFHHQPLYNSTSVPPEISNDCLSTVALGHASFSGGSSQTYQHPAYNFFFDRGHPSKLLDCSPDVSISNHFRATGRVNPGSPCPFSDRDFLLPEGMPKDDNIHRWRWQGSGDSFHGVSRHSMQKAMSYPDPPPVKRSLGPLNTSLVFSPVVQVPTPASMAVLLNHSALSESRPNQTPTSLNTNTQLDQTEIESGSREKKHGCSMCYKRFDRPSTLKKHLLVHTGEKAFVCNTCGRRFGVASNLNRHVRRCILKPVNAGIGTKLEPFSSEDLSTPDHVRGFTMHGQAQCITAGRLPSKKDPHAPKRRRRAPSPSRWIPKSLLSFNLAPPEVQRATPVPLPPVRRNLPLEERDSWDDNVPSSPYHPREWKNVLPGPGFRLDLGPGGKDVRNLNFRGNGGFMLGRLLVF